MVQVYPPAHACATLALRDAWTTFLGQWEWDWFCTLTFRDMVHPEAAEKRFRLLVNLMNRELYGSRWYKRHLGLKWVCATEYQRRGVIHFHALCSDVSQLRRLSYMDKWNELAGYARIEEVHNTDAVYRYVSKYVIKGGEITLGGALRGLPLPLFGESEGQA